MPHRSLAVIGTAFLLTACSIRTGVPTAVTTDCYRFDRPISYSGAGTREWGDSAWHVLQLLPGGRVDRPLLLVGTRERYSRRSTWRVAGDTLHIRVFDGLVGWDLTLLPYDGRYRGTGEYMSDARVAEHAPPNDVFSAGREDCASAP